MRRLAPLACVLVLAAGTAGCGHRGVAVFATGVFVGAAIASHHEHEHVIVYEPAPVVISEPYEYVPPPPPPARERVPSEPPAPSFDPAAARNALGNTNVAVCKASGAPQGYGHGKVTFAPDGHVVRVVVDSPAGMTADAVSCIGRELGTAVVPPFGGRDMTMGTNWLIR